MSYHKSMLPLGALGWPTGLEEAAGWSPPVTDPDRIVPSAKLCGDAKAIQSALKDQGYYSGAIDGVLGKGSVSAIAAFSKAKGLGNVSWPNPTFCAQLRGEQLALLQGKYEALHPPQPQGGQPDGTQPGGGVVTPGGGTVTPGQVAPPVVTGEDNTRTYLFVGGLAVFAVIGTAIAFALLKSGGSPEPAGA